MVLGINNGVLISQEVSESSFVVRLSKMRGHLIEQHTRDLKLLDSVFHHWGIIDHLDKQGKIRALQSAAYYGVAWRNAVKKKDIALSKRIRKAIVPLSLISDRYIDPTSPFILRIDSLDFARFYFMGIRDGDKIADIGAGLGKTAFIWRWLYPESHITVSELEGKRLRMLYQRFGSEPNIQIVKAESNSTKMEGSQIKTIIVQQTFHHFDWKKKMLLSIKKSLAPRGHVVVIENTKELKYPGSCRQIVSGSSIKRAWKKAGFELIEESIIGSDLFLKYRILDSN